MATETQTNEEYEHLMRKNASGNYVLTREGVETIYHWLSNTPKEEGGENSGYFGIAHQINQTYKAHPDFSGMDLSELGLSGLCLSEANLRKAKLWRADLRETDLRGADLSEAGLGDTYLWRADLSEANLRIARLTGAHLSQAKLLRADLRGVIGLDSILNLGTANLLGAVVDEENREIIRLELTEHTQRVLDSLNGVGDN